MRRYGALPPSDLGWQIGKTAASILFVNEAEKFIQNCQDEISNTLLRAAIHNIKKGKMVLTARLTPEAYLEQKEKTT